MSLPASKNIFLEQVHCYSIRSIYRSGLSFGPPLEKIKCLYKLFFFIVKATVLNPNEHKAMVHKDKENYITQLRKIRVLNKSIYYGPPLEES